MVYSIHGVNDPKNHQNQFLTYDSLKRQFPRSLALVLIRDFAFVLEKYPDLPIVGNTRNFHSFPCLKIYNAGLKMKSSYKMILN